MATSLLSTGTRQNQDRHFCSNKNSSYQWWSDWHSCRRSLKRHCSCCCWVHDLQQVERSHIRYSIVSGRLYPKQLTVQQRTTKAFTQAVSFSCFGKRSVAMYPTLPNMSTEPSAATEGFRNSRILRCPRNVAPNSCPAPHRAPQGEKPLTLSYENKIHEPDSFSALVPLPIYTVRE